MRRIEIIEAMHRALTRCKPVPIAVMASPSKSRLRTQLYEDDEIFAAILDRRMEFPRMVVKYVDEDTLGILHPALRCTTSFLQPLLVYIKIKTEITIGRTTLNRIPLIKKFAKPRSEERVLRGFLKLRKRYPTLVSAILSLPENVDEVVIVDGRGASLLDFISCPSVYGLYIGRGVIVYVGRS